MSVRRGVSNTSRGVSDTRRGVHDTTRGVSETRLHGGDADEETRGVFNTRGGVSNTVGGVSDTSWGDGDTEEEDEASEETRLEDVEITFLSPRFGEVYREPAVLSVRIVGAAQKPESWTLTPGRPIKIVCTTYRLQ